MHLGRFHVVIEALASHFKGAQLPQKLEQCAVQLDQLASARTDSQLATFRQTVDELITAASAVSPELEQPYARAVIDGIRIGDILPPGFIREVSSSISSKSFDPTGLAADLRQLAAAVTKKINSITAIDAGFTSLGVEYEAVDDGSAEIGFLLPREVVGRSLPALTAEFDRLSQLLRAVNELVAAEDYDPQVLTISSSWWQIFLDLGAGQILIWVSAIPSFSGQ